MSRVVPKGFTGGRKTRMAGLTLVRIVESQPLKVVTFLLFVTQAREDALKEVGERLDLWTFTNEEGWRIFPEATKFIEALCKGEMP